MRGVIHNPNRVLLPGFFVRMQLPMGKVNKNAPLVLQRAVQTDQGGTYLLVLDEHDVVQQRYVQLGPVVGNLQVVASGLGPEDRQPR